MSTAGPHKTAMQRWSLSRPVALAPEDGLLSKKTIFFAYDAQSDYERCPVCHLWWVA